MKTKEQRIVLGDRSLDPLQIAFVRALTDIECSLLDKVEAVANQKEAAELLTADLWRDLLTQVEIGRRSRLMRDYNHPREAACLRTIAAQSLSKPVDLDSKRIASGGKAPVR
jgi:hypothetical protein